MLQKWCEPEPEPVAGTRAGAGKDWTFSTTLHRPIAMMSAAHLLHVSPFTLLSRSQRSASSLRDFSSRLKFSHFWHLLSLLVVCSYWSLLSGGKNVLWQLASVLTLFASIQLLSLVALVTLSKFSAAILNHVFLSTLSTFAMIFYVCIMYISSLLSSSVSNPISLHSLHMCVLDYLK